MKNEKRVPLVDSTIESRESEESLERTEAELRSEGEEETEVRRAQLDKYFLHDGENKCSSPKE